jgi:hypothetical protein
MKCRKRWAYPSCLALALLISFRSAGRAETVTNLPMADTTLFETAPDNNLGASTLSVGTTRGGFHARALLQFDLSQIPTNATINGVNLTVNVVRSPSSGVPSVMDVRRVLLPWGEGSQSGNNGGPAQTGEATWNARFAPATLWTTPGGAVPADFSAIVSASNAIADIGAYTFSSTAGLVADVQAWTSQAETNCGWVLICEQEEQSSTARRLGSREDPSQAATLVVDYTLPPPAVTPLVLLLPQILHGRMQFSFAPPTNRSCTVEFSAMLDPRAWQVLTNLTASDGSSNAVIIDPIQAGARFYRVHAP